MQLTPSHFGICFAKVRLMAQALNNAVATGSKLRVSARKSAMVQNESQNRDTNRNDK